MDVEISVESEKWAAHQELGPFLASAARKAVEVAGLPVDRHAELSIVLADDDFVRRLNRIYLGHDSATNVLSFPQAAAAAGEGRRLLGDVALAYQTVAREAAAANKPLQHHAAHLVIHGLLHLFGYDHDSDETATEMEDIERAVLQALAIPDPHAQDKVQSEPAVLGPAS
jgi:probable rRNA maturation factor